MVAQRGETMVVRRWRPRRLNLELRRASMNYGEPSAHDSIKNGGLWRRGHDDGLGGGAPMSLCMALELTVVAKEEIAGAV